MYLDNKLKLILIYSGRIHNFIEARLDKRQGLKTKQFKKRIMAANGVKATITWGLNIIEQFNTIPLGVIGASWLESLDDTIFNFYQLTMEV